MKRMIRGVDVILGLDVFGNLGGVHVSNDGASFGLGAVAIKNRPCTESITDEDFDAVFDGKCWAVKWRWKDERNVRFSRQRNAALYGSAAREQGKSRSRSRLL